MLSVNTFYEETKGWFDVDESRCVRHSALDLKLEKGPHRCPVCLILRLNT